ncbi:hypothetical protein [Pedobacter caeni]|uniref:Uncharacterized protein n=1 Tax=Pedobacter caeni TaxID=288992 RepID=A0A1M5GU75_9SPHI|nr:hypothetical protein [Pedobacter caeni]SHG07250.1 hypothetical protein SAMN04488522_104369 [Pedobacter caeni]
MDELYYYTQSGLYFSQEIQTNPHITILDIAFSFFFGVLLITVLTLTLDQWRKEHINEMLRER